MSEQTDQYYCLLDSGANALIVPALPGMKGLAATRKVPGGRTLEAIAIQQCTLQTGQRPRSILAIQGAQMLLPATFLLTLAGWAAEQSGKEEEATCHITDRQGQCHALSMSHDLFWIVS